MGTRTGLRSFPRWRQSTATLFAARGGELAKISASRSKTGRGCRLGPPDDPNRYEVLAIVRNFGAEKGTAILPAVDAAPMRFLTDEGYFCSVLVGANYESYDRRLFEDTLNDWQWYGEGEPPEWYTGQPWSH